MDSTYPFTPEEINHAYTLESWVMMPAVGLILVAFILPPYMAVGGRTFRAIWICAMLGVTGPGLIYDVILPRVLEAYRPGIARATGFEKTSLLLVAGGIAGATVWAYLLHKIGSFVRSRFLPASTTS